MLTFLLLGFCYRPEQIGIYAIAYSIISLIDFGLIAVNMVIQPQMSELYATKNYKELQTITKYASLFSTAFGIFSVISLVIFGQLLLSLFEINSFIAYQTILILAIGKLVNSVTGPCGSLMTMTEQEKPYNIIMVVMLGVTIVLTVTLIPAYGLVGVAIAQTLSLSLWQILITIFVNRKLHINSTFISIFNTKHR